MNNLHCFPLCSPF